jgi:3'-phosphoadenosine 5'-phosphosulfate sulfotransferase (PAPS reductase)/FAD synthetase
METQDPDQNNHWPKEPSKIRHVLSLSGGKDSAALAVYLRDRTPNMEYIFHDTGKELPDTYEYLERLEGYLGRRIIRTTFGATFDQILRVKGGMLPSNHRRWCTDLMKLKPFENYIGDDFCINYVGIRADEDRLGYVSHKPNIRAVFPFREDKVDYAGVQRILENSGLGMPPYTEWGRTRSGCFFCFYQQKIEWVRLKQRYPDLYEEAKAYEKPNHLNGNIFNWNGNESLAELEQPERMAQIEANWTKTQARLLKRQANRTLAETLGGLEVAPRAGQGCLLCHL